jgi:hypothetical protein
MSGSKLDRRFQHGEKPQMMRPDRDGKSGDAWDYGKLIDRSFLSPDIG